MGLQKASLSASCSALVPALPPPPLFGRNVRGLNPHGAAVNELEETSSNHKVTRMNTDSASQADAKKVGCHMVREAREASKRKGFGVNTQAAAQTRPCMGRNVEGWA